MKADILVGTGGVFVPAVWESVTFSYTATDDRKRLYTVQAIFHM